MSMGMLCDVLCDGVVICECNGLEAYIKNFVCCVFNKIYAKLVLSIVLGGKGLC